MNFEDVESMLTDAITPNFTKIKDYYNISKYLYSTQFNSDNSPSISVICAITDSIHCPWRQPNTQVCFYDSCYFYSGITSKKITKLKHSTTEILDVVNIKRYPINIAKMMLNTDIGLEIISI